MSFGDVSSANVVGFQNKEVKTDGWNLICNTFLGVGKQKSEMTLGDFVPNANWVFSSDSIQFLTPGGATKTFIYKEVEYPAIFTYVPDPFAGMMLVDPGWYQAAEVINHQNPISGNEWPIEWGDGFVVEARAANTTLNFSGEVLKGAQNLQPITDGWDVMGNALPVPTTLSEITPNANWVFSSDSIQFLTPGGATKTFIYKEVEYPAIFTYVPDPFAGMMLVDPGWYQAAEVINHQNPISGNEWQLAAGEAFVVEVRSSGTELQLPAAIAE